MLLQHLRIDSTSATSAEKSALDLPTYTFRRSLNNVVEMQEGSNVNTLQHTNPNWDKKKKLDIKE